MAFTDEVQGRLGTQRLVELTNPGNPAATTIDTTRLNYALTDAQAWFQVISGVAYDNTVALHVATAVEGAIFFLMKRAGNANAAELRAAREDWEKALERAALVTGRNRQTPRTSSNITASRDPEGTTDNPQRGWADLDRWTDITLKEPQ